MKKRIIILCIVMLGVLNLNVSAQNRVIYEITLITEHKAEIQLKWKQDDNADNIIITGWNLIDDDVLQISYNTGANIPEGWNKKTIELKEATFPLRVVLKQQGAEAVGLIDLPDNENNKYHILNLYDRGVINGYAGHTFKPNDPVTRAEFATMVVSAANYLVQDNLSSTFTDVEDAFWGRKYIMTLAEKKILVGKGNNLFDPHGSITIGEVLTVIDRTFTMYNTDYNYKAPSINHWSNNAFKSLAKSNIVSVTDNYYHPYTPNSKATREQCAVLLSRVLQSLHKAN